MRAWQLKKSVKNYCETNLFLGKYVEKWFFVREAGQNNHAEFLQKNSYFEKFLKGHRKPSTFSFIKFGRKTLGFFCLTAIWLPHGQLCATPARAALLTQC